MPKRRLPNLTALPGFEATARHLSFTLAAEELHLTQGAVSRQVRELEAFLGRPLFRRYTRRIELTEDGTAYAQVVRDALSELARGTARFRNDATASRKLTVSILPTLASLWLMPRLHLFTQEHRGIEIRIVTSIEPAELASGEIDVAIRAGKLPGRDGNGGRPRIDLTMVRDWTGVRAFELFPDVLCAVASPRLMTDRPCSNVRGLLRHPLIHTSTRRHAWPDWLAAHGIARAEIDFGPDTIEFGHFFMSLEAARRGQGIALVPDILLANYEGREELVAVAPATLSSEGAYYLLIHKSRVDDPRIKAFQSWITSQSESARSR